MGKMDYLAMKTDESTTQQLIDSDLREIGIAAKKLANDAMRLGGLGFGTAFLKWVASFAAMWALPLRSLPSSLLRLILTWTCWPELGISLWLKEFESGFCVDLVYFWLDLALGVCDLARFGFWFLNSIPNFDFVEWFRSIPFSSYHLCEKSTTFSLFNDKTLC